MSGTCLTDNECRELLDGALDEGSQSRIENHLEACRDCQSRLDRLSELQPAATETESSAEGLWGRLLADSESGGIAGRIRRIKADSHQDSSVSVVAMTARDTHSTRSNDTDFPSATDLPAGTTDRSGPAGNRQRSRTSGTPASSDLSDYEILDEIGRGGMGVVYLARDRQLGRHVAIKMLLSGPHAGKTELDRFHREARAAARIQHPNIVQLFGVGEHDGCPFLVLEYVQGESLNDRSGTDRFKPHEAAEILEVAALAIHHAHQEGVLHRDLKPGNILLTAPADGTTGLGIPKIADFGLATWFDAEDDKDHGSVTRTGQFLGTPDFMAPEMLEVRSTVGSEADVYSLGATLYALLTGQSPHRAASPVDLLKQIRDESPVRPRQIKSDIPPNLETICLKCLEKSPESRYGSAKLLADDLRRFLDHRPILARPTPAFERFTRWCGRNPVVSSLCAVSAVLLLTVAVVSMTGWKQTKEALARVDSERTRAENSERETNAALKALQKLSDSQRHELVKYSVKAGFEQLDQGDTEIAAMWFLKAMQQDDDAPASQLAHRQRLAGVLRERVKMIPINVMRDYELYHSGYFIPNRNQLVIPKMHNRQHFELHFANTTNGDLEHAEYQLPLGDRLLKFDISPDNKFALLANLEGGQVALIDVESRELHALFEAGGSIAHQACIAFNHNATALVTVTEDGHGRQWNILSRSLERKFEISSPIRAVAVSNDARFIATTEDKLRVRNIANNDVLFELSEDADNLLEIKFCYGGQRLVARSFQSVCLWDLQTENQLRRVSSSEGSVNFKLDQIHRRLAVFQASGEVQVFDAITGEPTSETVKVDAPVTDVWFDDELHGRQCLPRPNNPEFFRGEVAQQVRDTMYIVEDNRTLRRWSISQAAPTSSVMRHPGPIHTIGRVGDRLLTLSGSTVYSLLAWEIPTDRLPRFNVYDIPVDISRDHRFIAYRSAKRQRFEVYDTDTSELHGTPIPYGEFNAGHFSAQFSSDAGQLAIDWGHFHRIEVFDVETGDRGSGYWDQTEEESGQYSFDFGGTRELFTASFGQSTRIYDRSSGLLKRRFDRKLRQRTVTIGDSSLSPDGHFVLSRYSYADLFDLIDTRTGQVVDKKFFQDKLANHQQWSPDSRRVAIALTNGEARIWTPLCNGSTPDIVMHHGHDVLWVRFSEDGEQLISGSKDRSARVWNTITGRQIAPSMLHDRPVVEAYLSKDGTRALTIDDRKTVNVWDIASGQRILPPQRFPGAREVLARFSSSADQLLLSVPGIPIRKVPLIPLPDGVNLDEVRRELEIQAGLRLADDGSLIVLSMEEMSARAAISRTKTGGVVKRAE